MQLILASSSPRRKELMKVITENFTISAANADETIPKGMAAECVSEYLAALKADTVSKEFPKDVIIACDTTVICDERILGKPRDKSECREFMKLLSGHSHIVITGCAIRCGDITRAFSVQTAVFFRELASAEIETYISSDEPYDKAGGYGIQGKASLFIEKINGDYFNVVGLPVSRLYMELAQFLNNINKGDLL